MKKIFTMLSILFIVITLSSCTGEEIARLKINEVSTDDNNLIIKETSIDLLKDEELAIWSEMDMKYKDDISLRFRLEILKDGGIYWLILGTAACSAFGYWINDFTDYQRDVINKSRVYYFC